MSHIFQEVNQPCKEFLNNHGYCIIKNILSPKEIETYIQQTWDWIEDYSPDIDRNNPLTWNNDNWPSKSTTGFIGFPNTVASWNLREKAAPYFRQLHNEDDLITSLDAFIAWRPWTQNPEWKPKTEGLHCDQNLFQYSEFDGYQGMIPLYPVTKETGGLQVVPDTNNSETRQYVMENYPEYKESGFILTSQDENFLKRAKLLECDAGDLLIWDSRTIHGGTVGTAENQPTNQLTRLAFSVAMYPRKRATERVLRRRMESFEKNRALRHIAYTYSLHPCRMSDVQDFQPPVLTDKQLKLL